MLPPSARTTPRMTAISALPLLLKAHLLGSVSARVALDARRSSPSRCCNAISAITNARQKLATQVGNGSLTPDRFQERAARLAELHSTLYNHTTPMQRAQAAETMLCNIRNLQRHGSDGARFMDQQCHPEQVLARGRDTLATAFWAGQLNQARLFNEQILLLAKREQAYCPTGYPRAAIVQSIFNHLQQFNHAHARDFNPQAAILKHFRQDLTASLASPTLKGR
ncbi:hypothetical protein [Stenotrophomonas sp.]|uniref:hypothetical protein n=1 Tax=Stenotrophomonas sp. TaxID=69392 RepID=UPI002FC841C2